MSITTYGNCALCKLPAELKLSHILPEFLYRPLYGEKHTAVVLDVGAGMHDTLQKGLRERLLCGECEMRFNKLETYYARVWLHPTQRRRPARIEPDHELVIDGLDYRRFKLFHLSVLWRMGVATHDAFRPVSLGSRQEKLRQLLLAGDPAAPNEFEFFGMALRDPETSGWQDGLLQAPCISRHGGQRIYIVAFAGVRWYYFASKHVTGRLITPTLSEEGSLRLFVKDWMDDPHFLSAAPHFAGLTPAPKGRRYGA